MRTFVGEQGFPPCQGRLELGAFGGVGTALDVFIGGFVRCDQTSARAALNRHVADGHAAFHRQIADRFAAIFDDIAGAAAGTGCADHGQSDVLGGHARAQFAGDLDLHIFGLFLDQGLGGQNMFHLGGADPVGQRAEGTMRCGVAVAANNGHAGQGPALFGTNDMHDALTHVSHRIIVDAEFLGVLVQRGHLNAAVFGHGCRIFAVQRGRHVVVRHSDGFFRRAHLAACHTQTFECLGAGDFVHKVAVDVQQAGAIIGLVYHMGVPDFVIECLRGGHIGPLPRVFQVLGSEMEKEGTAL